MATAATTRCCEALCRNGHPCRGYGRQVAYGAGLCHIHTHFFNTPEKVFGVIERNASIFQSLREREWAVRMLRSRLCMGARKHDMALYASERLETMISSNDWYLKHKADYIYTILLQAGLLRPLQMPDLWRRGVQRQLRVILYCTEEPNVLPSYREPIKTLLIPYFKNAEARFAIQGLLSAMAIPTVLTYQQAQGFRASDLSGQMWREVIELCFAQLNMRPFTLLSIDEFLAPLLNYQQQRFPHSVLLQPGMTDFVRATLYRHRELEREKLRRTTAPFKEQLVSIAFRPERVARALEAGLEVEDL